MNQKLGLISQLIALSEVDGYVSDQEIGLIQKIGNLMGIKNPDILEMFRKPVAFIPPVDHMERIVQFQRMMLLINIDQDVSVEEIEFVRLASIRMGLNPDAVKESLLRMHQFPNSAIPPEDLLRIFSKYMN
jgi:hypothetical protein